MAGLDTVEICIDLKRFGGHGWSNRKHPRANTVIVAPLTGSIEREVPTHIRLSRSFIRAEDVTVVRKESLIEPRHPYAR